jgi:hypothetical protein
MSQFENFDVEGQSALAIIGRRSGQNLRIQHSWQIEPIGIAQITNQMNRGGGMLYDAG